jgi:hypothetical protein
MLSVHPLLVWLWAPVVTRSRWASARLLSGFAATEAQSACIMRWASMQTTSVDRRVAYLRHAHDEERHARMFQRRAARIAGTSAPCPWEAEDLFQSLGELRFLAFVARAEARGRREFEIHCRAFRRRGDEASAALFERILCDEREHERYARDLLTRLATASAVRRATSWVIAWEAWRDARRVAAQPFEALYAVTMACLYLVLLPFALGLRLRDALSTPRRAPLARAQLVARR